jgi:hypothetical protein
MVTQGAPIIEDAKLKIGSPVGREARLVSSLSPVHIGAGPGHDNVIAASATEEQNLWASRA